TLATDYSKPVEFTVTAEDGTTQEYTVTVTVETANEGKPFVTTWKFSEDNESIIIPTSNDFIYDFTIDWGDGVVQNGRTGYSKHTYANAGEYTVKIFGTFPSIGSMDYDSSKKIISIDSWGGIEWQSMENAFINCSNLIYKATDAPDLSNVTSMKSMFSRATSFNGDIGGWNVSNVTDMAGMFSGATSFNGDISKWNMSNVTDVSSMFSWAKFFNQDIGGWDMSNVVNMGRMFFDAESFNQDIGGWSVSNVVYMTSLFSDAESFNGDISNWNVSNVTDMGGMFYNAISFNQDIGGWNVSNVTDMSSMFYGARNFSQDIGGWNVSNVTNMHAMFSLAGFNQDIGGWNVSSVVDMGDMFALATSFDQNLGDWDVSNVTKMDSMFRNITLSTSNYDALLIGWEKNGVSKNINFNGGFSKYRSQAAVQARGRLKNNNNWLITDGGKE
ncbi:BspA family leucine-rich repeat surface protein, partial [Aquimarina algiphila]